MITRLSRGRSGITLTEILISILILGVGMTSLLTLFPLGLLRVREASRLSRSAYLVESATADLETRNLLVKSSFQNWYSGQWYNKPFATLPFDPWIQDTPAYVTGSPIPFAGGAYRGNGSYVSNGISLPVSDFIAGPGLPVAYDPLWRHTTGTYLGSTVTEARFASGIGFVRADPDGATPSAHGLQRITNFPSGAPTNVPDIFVSPEDFVVHSETDASAGTGGMSPIVPDLTLGNVIPGVNVAPPQYDWKYTWMFTGQQADCTNGTVFTGDIVVFENRPFSSEPATAPLPSPATTNVVTGETVVEAIFGYTQKVTRATAASTVGYGSTGNRAVLLRWSASLPDPEIRAGHWIADVTYERNALVDYRRSYTDPNTGSAGAFYPYQRCHWYQIAKRTETQPSDLAGFREMTVWTSTPLKALTLLKISGDATNGTPVHVNAALVSPYVVNVFPRTIYTR